MMESSWGRGVAVLGGCWSCGSGITGVWYGKDRSNGGSGGRMGELTLEYGYEQQS
jgi:hypothetical protein